MSDGTNIGYAMLPVALSFEGITGDISQQLGVPLRRAATSAGQQAGQAMATGIEQAKGKVDSATTKVANAFKKVEDQAGKLRVAEAQLQTLRDKGVTDAGKLAAAEEKVAKSRRDLTAAENQHTNAQGSLTRAQETLTRAQNDNTRSRQSQSRAQRDTNTANEQGVTSSNRLGGSLQQITGHANSATKSLAGLALKGAGIAAAAAGVASVGSFFTDSVKSLQRIERINEQTATVVKSTGGAAKVSSQHVIDLAGSIENLTATEAETVQEGANFLLTFKNIRNEAGKGNDIFDQTVNTMTDLSRATGTDMKSASLQLGKALNDPVKGLSALSRVGITFDKSQQDMIKSMVEAGDTMGAQKIILKELDAQFGGSAANYAKTTEGRVELAKHAIGTLGETITQSILPVLGTFSTFAANALNGLAEKWPSIVENVKGYVGPVFEQIKSFAAEAKPVVEDVFRNIADLVQAALPHLQTLGGFLLDVGQVALPLLKAAFEGGVSVISGFIDVVGSVADFIGRNKELFLAIAGTITALFLPALVSAGVSIAATGISLGVMNVALRAYLVWSKAVQIATKAWAAVQWVLNAAMSANPLGLVIAAVVGLGAALYLAWTKSETFRNIVMGAWNGIKSAVFAVVSWFTDTVWPMLQSVWDGISSGIGTMVDWIRDHWKLIVGIITGPIGALILLVTTYWDQIKAVFAAAWDGIKLVVQLAWEGIKGYVNIGLAVFRGIGDILNWLWQTIFVSAWDGIKAVVSGAIDVIGGVIDTGKAILQGLADKAGEVKDWVVEKFTAVVDFFRNMPGKIKDFASGIFAPIQESAKSVFNAIAKLWNNTVGRLRFEVPSWVPGIGGKGWSVPEIPLLSTGGRIADIFKRATGLVRGPGGPTDDMVPSMLSNQESVNTAASTNKYWPLFARLNRGQPLWDALRAILPAFSGGGRVGYGLPAGTSISYGAAGFPDWVYEVGKRFNVKPSTYPGHQEKDGQNKGIDWSGSVADMQKFAEYLKSIAPEMEQVIWMNPETGEQIGVADGQLVGPGTSQPGYYRDDWSGHTDHVHTRQSYSFGGASDGQSTTEDSTSGSTSGTTPSFADAVYGYAGGETKAMTAAEAKASGILAVMVVNWPSGLLSSGATTAASTTVSTSSSPSSSSTSSSSPSTSSVDTIPLTQNPDGTWSSPNKAWNHLMQRESGGKADIVQQIQDSNSGGNEASGLFQIALSTWKSNGGTKYAPSAGEATAEQQAEIAAKIFNASGGSPWGAGLAGRESEDELRKGIQKANTTSTDSSTTTPATTTTTPDSSTTTSPTTTTDDAASAKKLREAKDKADDAETAASLARQKLAEIESDPKVKESAKAAQRAKVAKYEREAQQAKDDLAALEKAAKEAKSTQTDTATTESEQEKNTKELTTIVAGGILETLGIDGSWLPNPSELGIVKLFNMFAGISVTPNTSTSTTTTTPDTSTTTPSSSTTTSPTTTTAPEDGLAALMLRLIPPAQPANVDASITVGGRQTSDDDLVKKIRRLLPDQKTRLAGAIPVGR